MEFLTAAILKFKMEALDVNGKTGTHFFLDQWSFYKPFIIYLDIKLDMVIPEDIYQFQWFHGYGSKIVNVKVKTNMKVTF